MGTALWTALLAAAGYLLEDQYRKVGEYLNPVSNVILGLIVLGYLYRVATFRRRGASSALASIDRRDADFSAGGRGSGGTSSGGRRPNRAELHGKRAAFSRRWRRDAALMHPEDE